jgi:hypothetical protein
LEAFVTKEAWAAIVYAQSSNAVGGQGCSGGAVGHRKKTSDKKRLILKSLAADFPKLCRVDYLMRMVSVMHKDQFWKM